MLLFFTNSENDGNYICPCSIWTTWTKSFLSLSILVFFYYFTLLYKIPCLFFFLVSYKTSEEKWLYTWKIVFLIVQWTESFFSRSKKKKSLLLFIFILQYNNMLLFYRNSLYSLKNNSALLGSAYNFIRFQDVIWKIIHLDSADP